YLCGGPSHIDMYDMKPDAPTELRGPFKPIQTNVPGLVVSELMPLQAKIANNLAIVRGVQFPTNHNDFEMVFRGTDERNTSGGDRSRPVFGSVVSFLRRNQGGTLPPYVAFPIPYGQANSDPGDPVYLGAAYRPFTPTGQGMKNLSLNPDITLDQLNDRRALQQSFDRLRRDLDGRGEVAGMDAFDAKAVEMLTSDTSAFDVGGEPEKVRERYGKDLRYLQARRLVEAGVSVVTLTTPHNWDMHGTAPENVKIGPGLRAAVPPLDRGLCALISDLHERGLGEDVTVVALGELCRTPKRE